MYIRSHYIPIELYEKHIYNKFKYKPISLFNDCIPTSEELLINPCNILVIQEPNQFFGLHDWALKNSHKFDVILTWGQDLLDKCENALFLPFGTTYLHGKDAYVNLANNEKLFELSFICGKKQLIEGHFVRHKIYNNRHKITSDINLKWHYTYDGPKDYFFESSMFHLAIENSQNQNYFTEKIIDAFITKTIPVYRGCPNIDEFFDSRGFFIFNTEEEFFNIANSLTKEDYYARLPYIQQNYKKAIFYAEIFNRMTDILQQIVDLNNIQDTKQ